MLHNIHYDIDSSIGCLYDRSTHGIVWQCIYLGYAVYKYIWVLILILFSLSRVKTAMTQFSDAWSHCGNTVSPLNMFSMYCYIVQGPDTC
jgi:hypothetical protein